MATAERLFRRALEGDAARVWQIIEQARERMRLRGSLQWQDGHPTRDSIEADIARGDGYVVELAGEVAAYGAVIFDGEPAYDAIEGGWLGEGSYAVVHRLAVAGEAAGQGFGSWFMRCAGELAAGRGVRWLRVDTNFDNEAMLRIFASLGMSYRGKVRYRGGERLAYEKDLQEEEDVRKDME